MYPEHPKTRVFRVHNKLRSLIYIYKNRFETFSKNTDCNIHFSFKKAYLNLRILLFLRILSELWVNLKIYEVLWYFRKSSSNDISPVLSTVMSLSWKKTYIHENPLSFSAVLSFKTLQTCVVKSQFSSQIPFVISIIWYIGHLYVTKGSQYVTQFLSAR